MIEIKINHEVRDVSAEIALGLNAWQLKWSGIGMGASIIIGVLVIKFTNIPMAFLAYVIMLIILPFGAIAFMSYHEMNVIQLVQVYRARVTDPAIKTYHADNEEYIAYIEKHRAKKPANAAFTGKKRRAKKKAVKEREEE